MNIITFLIEVVRKFWRRSPQELDQIEVEAVDWWKHKLPAIKVGDFAIGEKLKEINHNWAFKLFLALFYFVAVKWMRNIMSDATEPVYEEYEDEAI